MPRPRTIPGRNICGSEADPFLGIADGRKGEGAAEKEEEEETADKGRHRDADGRGAQAEIVEPGVLAQRGDDAEWHADDDREDDGDDAELQRDRKFAGDQLLDRLGAFRGVGGAEVEAEDAGHVVQKLAVDERRGQRERIPDALGESEIDRLGVDPERLVESELGVERLDGRRRERLLPVPRTAGRAVHEKEGDRGHGDNHRDNPEHSPECVFQHQRSLSRNVTL